MIGVTSEIIFRNNYNAILIHKKHIRYGHTQKI